MLHVFQADTACVVLFFYSVQVLADPSLTFPYAFPLAQTKKASKHLFSSWIDGLEQAILIDQSRQGFVAGRLVERCSFRSEACRNTKQGYALSLGLLSGSPHSPDLLHAAFFVLHASSSKTMARLSLEVIHLVT